MWALGRKQKRSTMLEIFRKRIGKYLRDEGGMGSIISEQVANTVTLAQVQRVAQVSYRETKQRKGGERCDNQRDGVAEQGK